MAASSHVVLSGSERAQDPDASVVGDLDPHHHVVVTISLSGPDLPGPDEMIGQTLTPEELAARFGASKADADKVAASLERFGLKVDRVSLATRTMEVSGSAAQMEQAFRPRLKIMASASEGQYRGREGSLEIPSDLKGIVTGVFGLDQRRMARRAQLTATQTATALHPLTPADIEQHYDFPNGDCAAQKIAIAEFGGGYFASDTAAFCAKYQRVVPSVTAIGVDAPAYTFAQIQSLPLAQRQEAIGIAVEVMMDVEIIASLCPKAAITVYFSTWDQRGWIDLLNQVIAERPVVVSISYGLAEDDPGWSANALTAINNAFNAARLLGITACVSSGDDGSGAQMHDGAAHVAFPGSSPFVLSVGGTELKATSSGTSERVWYEAPGERTQSGGGATGGGVSTIFPRPAFQDVHIASLNPGSIDGRVVPDVAALAGEPFYDLIFRGHDSPNGGTSAAAPVWAALIARLNGLLPPAKQQRFLTPLLYANGATGKPIGASALRDITSGNNTTEPDPGRGYRATKGFDAVSGWGVPDGGKLLTALSTI